MLSTNPNLALAKKLKIASYVGIYLYGIIEFFLTETNGYEINGPNFTLVILFFIPFSLWYSADTLAYQVPLKRPQRYLFVIFGTFFLFFHFLKTRGKFSIPKFILFLCLITLANMLGSLTASLVYGGT